ncbi:trypco2 family protein [Streptomyces malaysiensis]|uniref:trypco2 family protein n=1 Tax=Streptomyces malaysiensis TaxID=92644 RepID=UPI0033C47945
MEIELADAVAAVRDELLEAAARGVGQDLAFKVGPVQLEFTVELRADAKAKAGFKAWVINTPQRPDGSDLLVHGDPSRQQGPGDVSGRIPD